MATTPPDLLHDLEAAGVHVLGRYEIVNSPMQYDAAIPVLIDWLEELEERVAPPGRDAVREGLVRGLSVPAARPGAAPVLIQQFRSVIDPSGVGIRWTAGNALEVTMDDSVFEEITALVEDRRYGKARQMLVLGMRRMKNPRAVPVLVGLLDDDDVAGHAARALGHMRAASAADALQDLLDHSDPFIRREAEKALARMSVEPQPRNRRFLRPWPGITSWPAPSETSARRVCHLLGRSIPEPGA